MDLSFIKEKVHSGKFNKYVIFVVLIVILFLIANSFLSSFNNRTEEKEVVFKLNGSKVVTVFLNDNYIEQGVTAYDHLGNDISDSVVKIGNVDVNKPGIYDVLYRVNVKNRTYEVYRTYIVVDNKVSYITLLGDKMQYLIIGQSYIEPGYIAVDYRNVRNDIKIEGKVDTNRVGVYKLVYSFTDEVGNTISDTRTVSVNIALPDDLTFKLIGDEKITLFLNSLYVESGYSAIDGIDGEITSKVIVTGNVNTSVPGTYELKYYVVNSSGFSRTLKREITVLAREIGKLELALVGPETVKLYVGEEFVDTYVTAIDSYEGDITDRVIVKGNVRTYSPGEYILEYSVKNVDGVEKKVTRNVIVYDNLRLTSSYSPKNVVNTDVKILLAVSSGSYAYTIFPDGQKSTLNNMEYVVSKNGTYTFTSYDVNGKTYKSDVIVNNIDKVLPTASCSAVVENSKTKVTVSKVSEENCTYQYILNKSSSNYSSSKTYSGGSASAVSVNVKDTAGNVKNVKCSVKIVSSSGGGEGSSYTDARGYLCVKPYVCYKQGDYTSSKYKYCATDNYGTISAKGCSITSVTIISSGFNKRSKNGSLYTPYTMLSEVYKSICSCGCSSPAYSRKAFNKLGLKVIGKDRYYLTSSNTSSVLNHLRSGNPVLIRVGKGWYTSGGHLMALLAYKAPNYVFLSDPATRNGTVNRFGHKVNTFIPITDILKGGGSGIWFQLVKG